MLERIFQEGSKRRNNSRGSLEAIFRASLLVELLEGSTVADLFIGEEQFRGNVLGGIFYEEAFLIRRSPLGELFYEVLLSWNMSGGML